MYEQHQIKKEPEEEQGWSRRQIKEEPEDEQASTMTKTMTIEVPKVEPFDTTYNDLKPDSTPESSLYADHVIKEEMVHGPTVFVNDYAASTVIVETSIVVPKIEPDDTTDNDLKSDSTPESSLYADHQIKEEMVLGPTTLVKPSIEYAVLDSSLDKKPTLKNNGTLNQLAAEKPNVKNSGTPENLTLKNNDKSVDKPAGVNTGLPNPSPTTNNASKCKSLQKKISKNEAVNAKDGKKEPQNSVNKPKNILITRYACDICNKSFTLKGNFNYHRRLHTGEKPYACDICNRKYTLKSSLKKHLRIHTGVKSFACKLCNKEFTLKRYLNNHHKIHTGEKPYGCDFCNKRFTLKSYLKYHVRIHTGEKPFACHICNKNFSQKSSLNIHLKLHTGDRPYACDICNKSFTLKGNLKKHMSVHIGKALSEQFQQTFEYTHRSDKEVMSLHYT